MAKASKVTIYNEAGTGVVARGQTNDNGATVTDLTGAVVVNREYQIQVAGGRRRGMMCTAYNAETHTASFT